MIEFIKNNILLIFLFVSFVFFDMCFHNFFQYQFEILFLIFSFCYFAFGYFNFLKNKKLNVDKDVFIATFVHDLKNPLIGEIRLLEMLIRKTKKTDTEFFDIYTQMLGTEKYMLEMVISLLNTYKYENCKINYNFDLCDFENLVKDTCKSLLHLTSEEKNLDIRIFTKNNSNVFLDVFHVRRVITNLLVNAIKYKKENTKIKVIIDENGKYLKVSIVNQGYYINPEMQKEIFKKYISKSAKFNKTSTGLGLYLSKKIVNAHGGEIFVSSTKEGVNTFGFLLPKLVNSCSEKLELQKTELRDKVKI